jgi:hypothetical protein
MRYFLSALVSLAWALWFGGLIAIFLVVTQVSHTFATRRDIFGEAGSGIFMMFERYQLVVGAVALVSAFALRLLGPSRTGTTLFCLLALAAVGGVVSPLSITPKVEAMRVAGHTDAPEFKKLHGMSMMVYSADAVILLIAGMVLPAALKTGRDTRIIS